MNGSSPVGCHEVLQYGSNRQRVEKAAPSRVMADHDGGNQALLDIASRIFPSPLVAGNHTQVDAGGCPFSLRDG